MFADGTFTLGEEDDDTEQTFDYRLWRTAGNTWYGPETVTLEGISVALPSISAGGSLIGLGLEPIPSGGTGSWVYTEQGVLEGELRAFEGIGSITGNGELAGLGSSPVGGKSTGSISANGDLAGLGSAPTGGRGIGSLTGGGSLTGLGDSFEWVTIHKTDDTWIKVRN
jgi:hypothetical protein